MLHHLSFAVSDLNRSMSFYDAVLGALGYTQVWRKLDGDNPAVGFGVAGGDDLFALKQSHSDISIPGEGFHLAFAAPNRAAVDRFHQLALQNGGRDNGTPGLRPNYGAGYYAAFVLDPDGYRLEAVVIDAS